MLTRKSNFLSMETTCGDRVGAEQKMHRSGRRLRRDWGVGGGQSGHAHLFLHLPQAAHHAGVFWELLSGRLGTLLVSCWCSPSHDLVHPGGQQRSLKVKQDLDRTQQNLPGLEILDAGQHVQVSS